MSAQDEAGLSTEVYRTSNEAFALAQQAAGSGDFAGLAEQARTLNTALDALWARVQEDPPSDPGVSRAWADGRLDVGYVLSKGELSTSTRLASHLSG